MFIFCFPKLYKQYKVLIILFVSEHRFINWNFFIWESAESEENVWFVVLIMHYQSSFISFPVIFIMLSFLSVIFHLKNGNFDLAPSKCMVNYILQTTTNFQFLIVSNKCCTAFVATFIEQIMFQTEIFSKQIVRVSAYLMNGLSWLMLELLKQVRHQELNLLI